MTQAENFQAIYRSGEEATIKEMLHQYKVVQDLSLRVAELEKQLNKNSQNSDKPPSSDGYKKPAPKNLRHKSGKKSGGQAGHEGKTLAMAAKADREITHWPNKCGCCGEGLSQDHAIGCERRQVHDLPPIKLEVTEHQGMHVRCMKCGETTQGIFPEEVTASVQYGSGIKGLMIYLSTQHLLPMERTVELLGDVVNSKPSEGTLMNALNTAAEGLKNFESAVKAAVIRAKVVHFDETGLRVVNKLHWLHVASTASLTYYGIDQKRGKEAHNRIGILPIFRGTGVHDAYKSYWGYEGMKHSLCNVHLERELKSLQEIMPDQHWPEAMMTLLSAIHGDVKSAKAAGATELKAEEIAKYQLRYRKIVGLGLSMHPLPDRVAGKRGCLKKGTARNLLERLRDRENEVLRFMHDFAVPFENNQAERDIRMTKVKQKVSGCFRSLLGAESFCRIRSYISTLSKQNFDILGALRSVFDGNLIMPAMP